MKKILAFCLLIAATIVFAGKEDKWLDGPALVVITKQEREEFKKLKTDADRDAFMKEFWARRDPSPATPTNEYKAEIERRIQEVDKAMKKGKSYENDLGLTLLLLGAPDEHKKEEAKEAYSADEEEEEAAPPQKQVLVYRKLPPDIFAGELEIEFVSGSSGWGFLEKAREQD